jgi:anti-sigma factor RsiW
MTRSHQDRDLLLQAYCDGVLDPASAVEFEREMAADEALRTNHDNLLELRRTLRSLPQDDLPPGLLAKVTSTVDKEATRGKGTRGEGTRSNDRSWRALAASAVIGAVVGGFAMAGIGQYNTRQDIAHQVVASHVRALLAPQPFDVASSDRHTVKPWFTTRIAESPQVIDLSAQGFVLAGGRVDVVNGSPIATVVYRRAAHVISLMTLPRGEAIPDLTLSGYNILSWSDNVFTYVAVSDVAREDLAAFQRAFMAAS